MLGIGGNSPVDQRVNTDLDTDLRKLLLDDPDWALNCLIATNDTSNDPLTGPTSIVDEIRSEIRDKTIVCLHAHCAIQTSKDY